MAKSPKFLAFNPDGDDPEFGDNEEKLLAKISGELGNDDMGYEIQIYQLKGVYRLETTNPKFVKIKG